MAEPEGGFGVVRTADASFQNEHERDGKEKDYCIENERSLE
jgi:hypothetical protein